VLSNRDQLGRGRRDAFLEESAGYFPKVATQFFFNMRCVPRSTDALNAPAQPYHNHMVRQATVGDFQHCDTAGNLSIIDADKQRK
jgi:hypothetical protein